MVRIDEKSYEKGFQDGLKGKPHRPADTHSYSYASGRVEGMAEREKIQQKSGEPL